MLPSTYLLLTLPLWAIFALAGFKNPQYVVGVSEVWYIGQTMEVTYDLGELDGYNMYTIALWQQAKHGGSAAKGPIISSTTYPEVRSSFNWTVSLYDFDLSKSNVFFLWLFNGSASNQGVKGYWSMSSAYFNISDADPPSSSTSASTSPSSSSSATPASSSSAGAASATTTSPVQDIPSTGLATATTSASAPHSTSSSPNGSPGGGGLSTGAGIGIGVGVGVAGFSAIVCAALVVWYKRRKSEHGERNPDPNDLKKTATSNNAYNDPSYDYTPANCHVTVGNIIRVNDGHPAELNAGGPHLAVEMDADDAGGR